MLLGSGGRPEHVLEVDERINAVATAGLGHGVVNRRRHAALVAPRCE